MERSSSTAAWISETVGHQPQRGFLSC
jgi:hypothetical protein